MARPKKQVALPQEQVAPKRKPGRPKKEQAASAAPNPNGTGHNRSDDAVRENFLQHRSRWVAHNAKRALLDKNYKDIVADLKSDGHKVIEMKVADALTGTPKQEAKIYADVHTRLKVARYVGHPMGRQLDLFEQPDRTPAVDRAQDEGWQASAEGKQAKPPYDASTPQHQSWLEGYNNHQSSLMAGFKPLEDDGDVGHLPSSDDGWGDENDPSRPFN